MTDKRNRNLPCLMVMAAGLLSAFAAGDQQKVTVLSGGKTVMTGLGPAGKTYSLTFPDGKASPSIR